MFDDITSIQWMLILVVWWLLAGVVARIAEKRGYNGKTWFFVSIFIGFLPTMLVLYLFFPTKKPAVAADKPEEKSSFYDSPFIQHQWYYLCDNNQHGPVGWYVIKEKLNAGKLTLSSYVWREGLEEWKIIEAVTSDQ
ncbi:MAG: DUF4339 domain-containing protein [Waddliaceae bacterium]|jgi:hypothetical protein|nr:DUF4339 domain-containing protein [Waddliaceae bacterium]MBT3579260.1 DUF4339 domain-containing protein [Waddliaceae bacterium]MBT4445297.1 DUF4339 domain-containing protein [Waddliaceae bacterium]MBT6928471.1 DUF4339 domain-containing protein [Waddliaceae bacterium]MBT7264117.1 DUF4339 domain-containing protein [Waddliaceae bacterium]